MTRRWRRLGARHLAVAGTTALALLLSACGGGAAAQDGQVTLRFQEYAAPGDQFADAAKAYGDSVTEATNGEMQFEWYWSSSVAPTDELAQTMNSGLLDMGRVQPPSSPAEFPTMAWFAPASSYNTDAFPAGLLQKAGAHLEFSQTAAAQPMHEDLSNLGIRYMAPMALVQQYDLLCKEPVRTLDDLRGKQVRIAGGAWAEQVAALGASPVTLLPEEIYEGYQRGIVDCVMTFPTHYIDSGLWELGGYYMPLQFNGWNQDGMVISEIAWDRLTEDQQAVLQEQVRVWLENYLQTQLLNYWTFATEGRSEHGIEFIDPDPEVQEAIDRQSEEAVDAMPASAPDSVENPEEFLNTYEDLHGKWLGIVEELGYDTETAGLDAYVASLEDPSQPPEIDLDPYLDRVMQEVYGL